MIKHTVLSLSKRSSFGRIKCFPSTLRQRNLKTQQSPNNLDLCLSKTRPDKSNNNRDSIVFEKLPFKMLNVKPAFSNSSGFKSVYEKRGFRDGVVWTVGRTVEIKLRFQFPPA